jgi:hypothetical protein
VSGEEGLAAKTRTWRVTVAVFAFTAIYFTGFFPPSNNPNELSRNSVREEQLRGGAGCYGLRRPTKT